MSYNPLVPSWLPRFIDRFPFLLVDSETCNIMCEIYEVIEEHGGLPDAFRTGDEAQEAS